MAIDLSKVEPLGSKSILLEQALRNNRRKSKPNGESYLQDMDLSDMLSPDFEWLNQDKVALQNLVEQMEKSIGQLSDQLREMSHMTRHIDQFTRRSKTQFEDEQKLMFRQIQTMNAVLKQQIKMLNHVEGQIKEVEIKQNNLLPNLGIGLIAGLMSAVTILASAPWITVLLESLRS